MNTEYDLYITRGSRSNLLVVGVDAPVVLPALAVSLGVLTTASLTRKQLSAERLEVGSGIDRKGQTRGR